MIYTTKDTLFSELDQIDLPLSVHDARRTDILPASCAVCLTFEFIWFGMTKKRYTFATDFGPIVQWIEWRFPKP